MDFWVMFGCLVVVFGTAVFSIRAAYRNGVTDGFGYAVEPTCPGYAAAGEFLRTFMAHRWPAYLDSSGRPPAVGQVQQRIATLVALSFPKMNPDDRAVLAAWLACYGTKLAAVTGQHIEHARAIRCKVATLLAATVARMPRAEGAELGSWLAWVGRRIEELSPSPSHPNPDPAVLTDFLSGAVKQCQG
jgi:hypothetical protein